MVKKQRHLKSIETEMETFTPTKVFDELLGRFNVFTEVENIQKLEHLYMPRISKFCNDIGHYERSNLEMRECITKFD